VCRGRAWATLGLPAAVASGPIKEVRLVTLSNIVLVGVDGSPESGAALDYAVAEAIRRGARLRVVSTYFPEYSVHGHTEPVTVSEKGIEVDVEAHTRRMVEEALSAEALPPQVDIVAAAGPAAGVLIDESAEVDVLVVGHRGRGGFASMLLGSVSLQCVLHAHCPVIVVRPTRVTESAPTAEPVAAGTSESEHAAPTG
jgi:nucleotide-binding universal stress UspA family protein